MEGIGIETPAEQSPELIGVVIPTRDRGTEVTGAIDSLLGNHWPNLEVIVVDQSINEQTRDAVAAYGASVHYIHSTKYGVAAARNLGVQHSKANLIGFVDDDCVVAPNWLATAARLFAEDAAIGVLYGNVLAGEHDEQRGFIPAYIRDDAFTARDITQKNNVEGISACMVTTRDAWQDIQGFDAMLGVGAPLRSGAETDYTIRALLAGYHVCESPVLQVTHHGFRNWEEGKSLVQRYWFGTGAMFAKHVKHLEWPVIKVLLGLATRFLGGGRSTLANSFGPQPYRLLQLFAFAQGFGAGLFSRSNRASGLFYDTAVGADSA